MAVYYHTVLGREHSSQRIAPKCPHLFCLVCCNSSIRTLFVWCTHSNYVTLLLLLAWISFCFSLLHIFMMIIAFDAFRRRSVIKITSVIFIHLLASLVVQYYCQCLCQNCFWVCFVFNDDVCVCVCCISHQSVLNTTKNGCLTALPLEFGIVICTGVYMAFVIHQNGYRSKRR